MFGAARLFLRGPSLVQSSGHWLASLRIPFKLSRARNKPTTYSEFCNGYIIIQPLKCLEKFQSNLENANIVKISLWILCSWFRASQVYINKCRKRCNNMQSIFYFTALSLYMFRVPSTPIIRSIKTVVSATGTRLMIVLLPHSNVVEFGHVGVR